MSKYLALILFFYQITTNIQAEEYHFAAIRDLAEQEVGKIVLTEVYRQLGTEITITSFSGKRAELEANNGLKDGEIMRIWTYGDENKNLIRIPTPYYHLVTTAFVKRNSQITLNTKKDLSSYKLARVRGVKHTDNISANMPHVVESSSTSNMFKLLEQGTIDIALADYEDGMLALSQIDIKHHIIPYPMPLARFDLYHYIHKSHRSLVNKVDDKIKELKASGELDKITQNARHEVFSVLNFEDSITNQ